MQYAIKSTEDMVQFGRRVGLRTEPGTIIELIGDLGSGKTTFVKGLAEALGVKGAVQSPTFTIQNTYLLPSGSLLCHYDFYRLEQAGLMADELAEAIDQPDSIVVIEWSGIVQDVLPEQRVKLTFAVIAENERTVNVEGINDDLSAA